MNPLRTLFVVSVMLVLSAFAGCSARSWYEGTQRSAENYCNHLPPGDVDQCLKGMHKQTYEEYEKERTGQP